MAVSANAAAAAPDAAPDHTYHYKIVLLGESAVGKSSLALRFVKNIFSASQESTIGAAFLTQSLHVDGDTLKFEIWDTAGQERYHSLAPMYYRGANAAIIVYDITSHDSFERAKKWVCELQKQAAADIVLALIGNKTDLETQRQVTHEDVQAYAQGRDLILLNASAKTGDGVAQVFDAISQRLPRTTAHLVAGRSFGNLAVSRRINLAAPADRPDFQSKSSCC